MQGQDPAVMILKTVCSTLALVVLMTVTVHAETFRWTDDAGVVHFSDNHNRIPARYRQKATIVNESSPVNIMPAARVPERAVAEPVAVDEQTMGVKKLKKKHRHSRPGKKKIKQELKSVPATTTPARDAQNRAEERIRQDRKAIDDAQLPARRAQDQAEEQIRKAREKTMGH
jgi:Domain of unknown function (DUF4124)